jgi:very-short-patch-repair endonuclease
MAQAPILPPCGEGGPAQPGRMGVAPTSEVNHPATPLQRPERPPSDPSLREGPPSPSRWGLPHLGGNVFRSGKPDLNGGRMKRATVGRARELRKSMTRYEVKLWLRLRDLKAQGFRFRRQVPLERWIADFACLANRVVVEIDGNQHGTEEQSRKDAERDAFLTRAGFTVLRFANHEVWQNIEGVLETIFQRRSKFIALSRETSP